MNTALEQLLRPRLVLAVIAGLFVKHCAAWWLAAASYWSDLWAS